LGGFIGWELGHWMSRRVHLAKYKQLHHPKQHCSTSSFTRALTPNTRILEMLSLVMARYRYILKNCWCGGKKSYSNLNFQWIFSKVVFGWRENGFLAKSFPVENVFPRKIDFHVTFSIVWYKINDFLYKVEKVNWIV